MSNEVTEPQGDDTDNTPQGDQTQQAAPQGDSQPQGTDWQAEARKWESRAKKDAERLKAMEARVKNLITPEQVQDTAAENEALKREVADLRMRDVKREIGAELGLPKELWDRLSGSDADEIRADAERLKAVVKATTPAADAKKGQAATPPEAAPDANQLLRLIARG